MNKSNITAILAIICITFSAGAMAQSMSKNEYKAAEKNIKAEYKSAKTKCGSFAGNAKDVCMAEAKGKEKVAKAELGARYKPSKKADNKVTFARQDAVADKRDADYAVAKEKCNAMSGEAKAGCMNEAASLLTNGLYGK